MVPFNSNFWSYWSRYWATWLPGHPKYEMIELTAYENPKDPDDVLVRVFLTERAGRKTQYFYLNDQAEVRRSRANAYFANIRYARRGPAGRPQGLEVAFTDRDGIDVRWSIAFPPGARLRTHGSGLTPSIHSVGSVLLFALRTRTVDTNDDHVFFGGTDYAHQGGVGDQTAGTRSWYNPDYYSAVLVYGRSAFTFEAADCRATGVVASRGRRIVRVSTAARPWALTTSSSSRWTATSACGAIRTIAAGVR